MFEGIYPLIALHTLALLWSSMFFLPASWIRWGWMWYLQILITEWVSLSFVLALVLANISPTFIWFFVPIFFYLAKRNNTLQTHGINLPAEATPQNKFASGMLRLSRNFWPFQSAPRANKWTSAGPTSDLIHLQFPAKPLRGVCIHIHGGAWKHGDASQLTFIANFFQKRDIEVLSINYKKHPEHCLTEIVASVEETFLKIRSNYPPEQKFILYGRSAGGHLALMLAARWPDIVDRVVALYPVSDLSSLAKSPFKNDILKTPTWIKEVVGGPVNEQEPLFRLLSPSENLPTPFPATLLVHGANDPVVTIHQSDLLYKKMVEKNAPVTYLRFAKATHGFDALWNGISMQTYCRVLGEFLKR